MYFSLNLLIVYIFPLKLLSPALLLRTDMNCYYNTNFKIYKYN